MAGKLVLDIECTVTKRADGSIDFTPFCPSNYLVSIGIGWVRGDVYEPAGYYMFRHDSLKISPEEAEASRKAVQDALDTADTLIAANCKFDYNWIRESGFTYEGSLFCTVVAEYLLQRGVKGNSLSLDATAARRGVYLKKGELVRQYLDDGVGFNAIPVDIVREYGEADCRSAGEVYLDQMREYRREDTRSLQPILDMSQEFCRVLADIERNGHAIDVAALDAVEAEYKLEQQALNTRLDEIAREVMGDRPINLASPEQLSMLIYSRRVLNKKQWAEDFNVGTAENGKPLRRPRMSESEFMQAVRSGTERLKKQKAVQCGFCKGTGKTYKTKKNGELFAKPNHCVKCSGAGVLFIDQPGWAGLKLSPRSIEDVAQAGFSTSKETLQLLSYYAKEAGNEVAVEFLTKSMRLNAVDSYLSSFVNGIRRGIQSDLLLHPSLNQSITATGRLSSSSPNFQNLPRSGTFPIRKVVVSRWEGGEIMEADYAGLEFIVAGELANDEVIAKMKRDGIDAHKTTAALILQKPYDAITKDERQDAKAHTFAPLYGAMGMGLPAYIQRYYQEFGTFYSGVGKWHTKLQDEAINRKKITLPDGRQFAFPHARRMPNGGASGATQIKNFPVQSAATATIVPLGVIRLWKLLRLHGCQSLICNTVHDSVVIDRHPNDPQALIANLLNEALTGVKTELLSRFGWAFRLPLDVEVTAGKSWLDKEVIHVYAPSQATALGGFIPDEIPF